MYQDFVLIVIFKSMNRFVFFLFFTLINFNLLFAQFEGVVLSVENKPIPGVNVFLSDQNLLLYTNSEGVFSII